MKVKSTIKKSKFYILGFSFTLCTLYFALLYAQDDKPEGPVLVNGDTVEYSADSKEISATGSVEVNYAGSNLSCKELTVNTLNKDVVAQGDVRLEDKKAIIEGDKVLYNFNRKTGTILNARFESNPYFGRAKAVEKMGDEFIAYNGYVSTCNYDRPHYRIQTEEVHYFMGDKVQTKGDAIYVGSVPIMYLPHYNQSLKDKSMHVQVTPGSSKDWGPFILTAWRYNLTEHVNGKLYFDYRQKLGHAQGFGTNYDTTVVGKGDFKFYYTYERPKNITDSKFQRYLVRWRHRWDIDKRTNFIYEYYKIVDAKMANLGSQYNLLKDFFPREYEKDEQPLSYILLHRALDNSSVDLLFQKRTNPWYSQLEKLPQLQYTLPSIQIAETPFYFESVTQTANMNKKNAVPSPNDINMARFDTNNKFLLPKKISFLSLSPFVGSQETFYNKDVNGLSDYIRTIFYAGADASMKLYRTYNVKQNFLKMEINDGLRHIITPLIRYKYTHTPTIASNRLKQMDDIDAIALGNLVSLELSNKLQTKRNGSTVNLVDFRIATGYSFYSVDPITQHKSHGSLSDFLINLELLPYSWLRVDSDATYKTHEGYFSSINYDINFFIGEGRSVGIGQRYEKGSSNEITASLDWRLNPKWKFSIYERYNMGHDPNIVRGLREQEYRISRDMHCWIMDVSYNIKKEGNHSIWLAFRLKAFPEMEVGFNQSYSRPTSGSQSNQ